MSELKKLVTEESRTWGPQPTSALKALVAEEPEKEIVEPQQEPMRMSQWNRPWYSKIADWLTRPDPLAIPYEKPEGGTQYVIPRDEAETPIQGLMNKKEQGLDILGRSAAEYASGLTLRIPETVVSEISGKPFSFATSVDKILGIEPSSEIEAASGIARYMGLVDSAGKGVGFGISKLPMRESLRLMSGGAATLGGANLIDQTADKIVEGKDIDWNEVKNSAGWGLLFGAIGAGAMKYTDYRDVNTFLKENPKFQGPFSKPFLARIQEAGRAAQGGMQKDVWMKTYGEDAQRYVNWLASLSKNPEARATWNGFQKQLTTSPKVQGGETALATTAKTYTDEKTLDKMYALMNKGDAELATIRQMGGPKAKQLYMEKIASLSEQADAIMSGNNPPTDEEFADFKADLDKQLQEMEENQELTPKELEQQRRSQARLDQMDAMNIQHLKSIAQEGKIANELGPVEGITENDIETLQSYKGFGAETVNKYLRKGQEIESYYQNQIPEYDAVIAKMSKHEGEVYRKFYSDEVNVPQKVGEEWTDKGYLSAGLDEKYTSEKYAGDVLLKIQSKNAADINLDKVHFEEHEVVFPRDTKFRVTNVNKSNPDLTVISAEEVPVEAPAPAAPAKQPWEMTFKEYISEPGLKAFPENMPLEPGEKRALDGLNLYQNGKVKRLSPKQVHSRMIKQALSEGKSVPHNVLEEYKGEPWADEALAKGGQQNASEIRRPLKQEGATSLIPDTAAEVAEIGKKAQKPISALYHLGKVITEGVRKGATHIKTLGPAGQQLGTDLEDITFRATKNANNDIQDIKEIYKGLSKKQREQISKYMNGRIEDISMPLQLKAQQMREVLDRSMNEASDLGMTRTVGGKKIPVGGSGKAFPQVPNEVGSKYLDAAMSEGLKNPKIFEVAKTMVEKGQAKDVQTAVLMLQNFREMQLRNPNGYLERSRIELPEDWLEWDGKHILPALLNKNWMTVEGVRMWGTDQAGQSFPKAKVMLEDIRTNYGKYESDSIKEFLDVEFGGSPSVNPAIKKMSDAIRAYQFDTKVAASIPTILRNMFDRGPKGMSMSPIGFVRATLDYPPFINMFMKSARKIEDQMRRAGAVFGQGTIAEGYEQGGIIRDAMGKPFGTSEEGNQTFIALVHYHKLLSDLKKIPKADLDKLTGKIETVWGTPTRALKYRLTNEYGLSPEDIEHIANGLPLPQDKIDQILHNAVRDKAYPLIASTKPIWYDTHPMIKAMAQYKTWPVRQVQHIWNDVLKYTAKTGDSTRLLGFLTGTLLAGELYNISRDYLFEKDESALKTLLDPDKRNKKDIGKAILNDLLDGGVVGVFADLSYGIYDWAAGVQAGTAKNIGNTIASIKKAPEMTLPALRILVEKEVAPARQLERLADKVDRQFNKNNLTKNFYKWRSRSWEFKNDYLNPSVPDKIQHWTDEVMFGMDTYPPTENTVAYQMAARNITVGDYKDAAYYIKYAKKNGKKRSEIRTDLERYGPFGPIAQNKMGKFLQKYPSSRQEIMDLRRAWNNNLNKSLQEAYK